MNQLLINLPTDILLHLLNSKFSLQQLFHLRGLCQKVCSLIESPSCIGRRRTLKLFWSFSDIKRYTFDLYQLGLEAVPQLRLHDIGTRNSDDLVLISAKFTESTCHLLVRLFPRVQHLVIYFRHNKIEYRKIDFYYGRNYPDYLLLAEHLFPRLQLTGLSLFGKFNHSTCHDDESNTVARVAFCEAINRINSLKRLDMCLENLFDIVHPLLVNGLWYNVRLLLPARIEQILPRLEQLSICYRSEHFGENILGNLGRNCKTLRLHRLFLPTDVSLINHLIRNSITLTHLQLTQQFYIISQHAKCFAELVSIELIYSREKNPHELPETMLRLDVILPNLAQLTKLTKLTLMGFDITIFNDPLLENIPIMGRITQLSINSGHYLLKDPTVWFRGLAHIFPTVHHLTLSFNMDYTVDLNTDLSGNFQQCTHFRLLHILCEDLTHTLVSSLSRHHRKRFYRIYDYPGMSVDLWSDGDQHEAEQLWKRKNGETEWVKVNL